MSFPNSIENDFLNKLRKIIEDNLSDEQFGVSALARKAGMSRSNLLRKLKKINRLSVSQFINQVRLQNAMELLRESSDTVSEISYKVGFGSTSYFIKCFREYYGYPPGQVGKGEFNEADFYKMDRQTESHQLVAIMFTDIEGYTALMQQDEEKALSFINRHREIFNTLSKKFNGKILQYYGDGTLSTFQSAIDAVNCGIAMQLAFREAPIIPVRIGIHSGDTLFTRNGIIGDGVNIASRIESLAVPQSVFISEKVFDEIKNQTEIQSISLGKFEFKNVKKAIEVYAISNPGLIVPEKSQLSCKSEADSEKSKGLNQQHQKKTLLNWFYILLPLVVIAILFIATNYFKFFDNKDPAIAYSSSKKSIAVLPFINDSNDSNNVYIINGLMESILNNLQQIEDLRVISRTSVEKYRRNPKTIPEISDELHVNYLLEGSGQKIGNQILLNIQLIEAESDRHLWSNQYNREVKDIFKLQMEVSKKIADEIKVFVTPEEEERINQVPTDNLIAYDYFLKGLDLFYKGTKENLEDAIIYFKLAIEEDPEFARAYADIAIAYYLLDVLKTEKQYTNEINSNADKALLYDPELAQSLVAKAFFYMHNGEYNLAIPHFEKALQYNPNSALVINILSDFYTRYSPNTQKYLEYALRGASLDAAANDSITNSFIHLHISNALIQSGFPNEAEIYINKSLLYDPNNLYSVQVKAYIQFAKTRDLRQTLRLLTEAFNQDTTRLDIMQEMGKIHYYLRDYKSSYMYYKRFKDIIADQNLDIYRGEDAKIGLVYSKVGKEEEAEVLFDKFKGYAEADQSIYKQLSLAVFYAHKGDTKSAIQHLALFSEQDNYHYWTLLFLKIDPLIENIKDLPEFKVLFQKIERKFWDSHKEIKISLEAKNLI